MKRPTNTDLFLSVVEANKGILYKVTNAYCHNPDDRQDLLQEIIVQLWKSFDNYNEQYKYTTWIYRIALNVAISFYRKENRRQEIANPLPEQIMLFTDESEQDLIENTGVLQRFIAQLKELDRALILLYLEERPQKEIAQIMGISESNVATKISRIKQVLKQKFEALELSNHGR